MCFNECVVIIDRKNVFEYKKSCYRVIVEKCVFIIFILFNHSILCTYCLENGPLIGNW